MTMMGADLTYGPGNYDVPWLRSLMGLPKEEQLAMMNNHIIEVLKHYPNQISIWRVANEFRKSSDPDVKDIYARTIGNDYVELAFQTAREHAPDAILIYNENSNETRDGYYYQHTLQVVNGLKAKGLIDGVGLQMHIFHPEQALSKDKIIATMQSYELPVYITEFDVDLIRLKGTPQDRYARQAEIYRTVTDACLESGVCKGIYLWESFGDNYNWLERMSGDWRFGSNADATLFFDDMTPKPAYYAVLQSLFEHIAWVGE